MQPGDLVRFKPNGYIKAVDGVFGFDDNVPWKIGLLVEYHTWEKVATIYFSETGELLRIRAENVQKAGKRELEEK